MNQDCCENAKGMLTAHARLMGYDQAGAALYVLDGKVWRVAAERVRNMGDYYVFMGLVRQGRSQLS
jgi:hypothetical protein